MAAAIFALVSASVSADLPYFPRLQGQSFGDAVMQANVKCHQH